MSLYHILLIMLIAGLLGGVINYFLTSAETDENSKSARNVWRCMIIGLGATILVPLFLEIAQSKLLDHVRNSWDLSAPAVAKNLPPKTDSLKHTATDTTKGARQKADALKNDKNPETASADTEVPPLKTYFLIAAYCLLAAAAGPRFINNLMDGVLKSQQIKQLEKTNTKVTKENEKIQETRKLDIALNTLQAEHDEEKAVAQAEVKDTFAAVVKPQIGPKTNLEDPQKGRFGGKREVNGRKLCASVTSSGVPRFYKVKIWVESTDAAKALSGDVIFYLHDTFRPSVITLPEIEFTDGKAVLESKIAWGAFTVGAVLDGGNTLLEYDLAQDPEFPTDFRSR